MEGYQKYVGDFKKVRLLCIGTLILSVLLIIYIVIVPMFTYGIAGLKEDFSLADNYEVFNETMKLTGKTLDKKDALKETGLLLAPFMILWVFISMPSVGLWFGGFKSADAFAKGEYERIKENKKRIFVGAHYSPVWQIIRVVIGLVLMFVVIRYVKNEGAYGYFVAFKGINFFGVLYILLIAAGNALFFYAKKEYHWIKYQIEHEA